MRHLSSIFILYMLSSFLCHAAYADQIEKKSTSIAQMYSLASAKIKEGRELKTGMKFDAFTLTDFEGKVWDNESIRGKVTVVNVWYSGCGPCLKEMPIISKWKEEFPQVNFLSVNFESKEIMQKIVEQRGFTWTHCPEDRYFTSWVVTDNLEGGYPLKYQMMVAERNIENYNNLATLCNTLINVSLIDQALLYLDAYCAIDSTNSAINSVKAYALHRADRHKGKEEVNSSTYYTLRWLRTEVCI